MAIIKCPECGHQISEKAAICPICGVEIAGKIAKCSVCGEVFFKDDGLCPRCYSPFKEYKESEVDNDTVENTFKIGSKNRPSCFDNLIINILKKEVIYNSFKKKSKKYIFNV
jgi:uncharacterized OB-fold protein